MNKLNLIPHQAQPISRITTGQMPRELAELSEEVLGTATGVSASFDTGIRLGNTGGQANFSPIPWICSFDGDDVE